MRKKGDRREVLSAKKKLNQVLYIRTKVPMFHFDGNDNSLKARQDVSLACEKNGVCSKAMEGVGGGGRGNNQVRVEAWEGGVCTRRQGPETLRYRLGKGMDSNGLARIWLFFWGG